MGMKLKMGGEYMIILPTAQDATETMWQIYIVQPD
jgi:hypothetical protein